jgi:hypothetical protein
LFVATALISAFWMAIATWGVAFSSPGSRAFLVDHWASGLSIGAGTALAVAYAVVKNPEAFGAASFRAGVILGIGLPMIVALLLSVVALPSQAQLLCLRSVFLLLVIFTPSVMWWLFVASQRESLLNEFLANLGRLGLLEQTRVGHTSETPDARETRVAAYLQKFEANFVKVPPTTYDAVARQGRLRALSRDDDEKAGVPLATTAVPVLVTTVVLAVGWLLTLPLSTTQVAGSEPRWLDALVPNPTPVTMAFLGAYFFSLQMVFRRYVRGDLRGSAYVAVVMRVILAVVGTWVVTEVAKGAGLGAAKWQLLTLGFVIGVFPKVAWQVVQMAYAKTFKGVLPSLEAQLPLSELDGLTVWHEARLEEEDIENVPNMATADLVELFVSTRYSPDRLIEWVDQAILLTQLGPDQGRSGKGADATPDQTPRLTTRDRLATHGIRNASTLLKAAEAADAGGTRERFDAIVTNEAGDPVIPTLLVGLRSSCNFQRVLRWRGIDTQPLT